MLVTGIVSLRIALLYFSMNLTITGDQDKRNKKGWPVL